jgi:serine/threonine-protein kinase
MARDEKGPETVAAEPRAGNLVGSVIEGAYRVTRLLGEGGMGAVYEAVQLRLDKRVAVKVMARELAANQEALARFHREAQITSRLGHPHLVNVIDFGTAESGEPYMVMEYLEGEDLEHRIRETGRLPIEIAVHITRQLASALAAAHEQGIVHRDLKPANVFLLRVPGEPDFVKILDFGISKMKAARTQLTRAAAVMGTPNYMSPEQATGMVDEIDHRTDQWAVGCIVWEMLSGRGPFVADDVSALLYQVINLEPQPLGSRVPDLPAAVEPVLRRALSKKLAARYPSIRDFARAFEAAALGGPVEATPPPAAVRPPKETLAYGATRLAGAGETAQPGATTEAERDTAKQATTFSQTAGELVRRGPPRGLRRRAYAIGAGAALVLLLGALLFFRAGSAPGPAATSPTPATPAPPTEPAPAPPPAPTVVPEPPPAAQPAAAESNTKRRGKSGKWVDPFASPALEKRSAARAVVPATKSSAATGRAAPPAPSTPKPKPKKPLFKEL